MCVNVEICYSYYIDIIGEIIKNKNKLNLKSTPVVEVINHNII